MIRSKDILNCLPLLASVLGNRYGVQVRIGGKEACTNGKVIHLPSLPMDCEPELLALSRAFIDHESSHIRYTDFPALKSAKLDPVTLTFCNCLEDWRVENKLSDIFPGCRQNLNWMIRRFFVEEAQPRAGGDSPALSVMDYVLLTVRSWDVDEVNKPRMEAAEVLRQNFPGLKEALDAILVKVRLHCPDTTATIGYARQLTACIRQWIPAQQGASGNNTDETRTKTGSKQKNNNTPGNGSDSKGTPVHSDSASQKKQKGSSACASQAQPIESPAEGTKQLADLFNTEAQCLPSNVGDRLSKELTGHQAESESKAVTVAVESVRSVGVLPADQKQQALQASVALRTRIQGLLQARMLKHSSIGRRGRLHPGSLHRLQTGNPRIFRKETEQPGLNTAVHILLDASGSMCGNPITLANLACYAVAKALEHIRGINSGVTVFPAVGTNNSVFPIIRHGQPVSDLFDIRASGATPLAEALWWILQTMLPLKEQRKIILIITDGSPDNPQTSQKAIETALKLGFEVYGLGIRNDSISSMLSRTSRVIRELSDLAPAMLDMMQQILLKGE